MPDLTSTVQEAEILPAEWRKCLDTAEAKIANDLACEFLAIHENAHMPLGEATRRLAKATEPLAQSNRWAIREYPSCAIAYAEVC